MRKMMLGFPPWPVSGISGGQEIGLRDIAAGRVGAAGDDEEVMHSAVVGAVGIPLKAGFTDGASCGDEPGDGVLCPAERGDSNEGIVRRDSIHREPAASGRRGIGWS